VLIKQEYVEDFRKQDFTGLEFRPVDLFKNRHCVERVEDYVHMKITGRVKVDEERSGLGIAYQCPICGHIRYSSWDRQKGLHFEGNPDDWPEAFMMEQPRSLY